MKHRSFFQNAHALIGILIIALAVMLLVSSRVISDRVVENRNVIVESVGRENLKYNTNGAFKEITCPQGTCIDVTNVIDRQVYDGSPIVILDSDDSDYIIQYLPNLAGLTSVKHCLADHLPAEGVLRIVRKNPLEQSGNVYKTDVALALNTRAIYSIRRSSDGTKIAMTCVNGVFVIDMTKVMVTRMKVPEYLTGIIMNCWWSENDSLLYLDTDRNGRVCTCEVSTGLPVNTNYDNGYPYIKFSSGLIKINATRNDSNGEILRLIDGGDSGVTGMLCDIAPHTLLVTETGTEEYKLTLWDTDECSVKYFYSSDEIIDCDYVSSLGVLYYSYRGENGYCLKAVYAESGRSYELTGLPGGDFIRCSDGSLFFFGLDGYYCRVIVDESGKPVLLNASVNATGDIYDILECIAEAKRICSGEESRLNKAFTDSVTPKSIYSVYGLAEGGFEDAFSGNVVRQSLLKSINHDRELLNSLMPESNVITDIYVDGDRATVSFFNNTSSVFELSRTPSGFRITGVCSAPYTLRRAEVETAAESIIVALCGDEDITTITKLNDFRDELKAAFEGADAAMQGVVCDVSFYNTDTGRRTNGVLPADEAKVLISFTCGGVMFDCMAVFDLNAEEEWELTNINTVS